MLTTKVANYFLYSNVELCRPEQNRKTRTHACTHTHFITAKENWTKPGPCRTGLKDGNDWVTGWFKGLVN